MIRSTSVIVALLACTLSPAASYSSVFVPSDLHPGDPYYLAFVTRDTRDATSSNISDYNQFVQSEATQSAALTGTGDGVQWRAIASTPTVANSNLGLLSGVPIYDMNAFDDVPLVSDASALLLNGTTTSYNVFVTFDQFGLYDGKIGVWTGTQPGGASAGVNVVGGSSGTSIYGLEEPEPFNPTFAWLDWSSTSQTPARSSDGLYAVSTLLTVPTPEPATASLLLLGGAVLLTVRIRRREISGVKGPGHRNS